MKLSEILKRIKTYDVYEDSEVTFITADSRKVCKGCVFVCIKGNNFDGHDAARQAVENGAVCVVCSRDLGLKNQIKVKNTREAFSLMCAEFFGNPADRLKLIGITGTNGKTTTAFLIKNMLEQLGHKTGLIGTVKNMAGDKEFPSVLTTPESFELHGLFSEMVKEGCEYCVMEVSSQALAQERAAGLHFASAIFTNLTQDHLDYHGTFENYAEAKSKLFAQADTCILNLDDEHAMTMMRHSDGRPVTYSVNRDESDYTAKYIRYKNDGIEYELVKMGYVERVKVGIPGEFTVYNSMAAAVALIELGFDFSEVVYALSLCKGVKGRIEVVPTDTDYTVIIDYAHSPDGLENIISSLRKIASARIITVFGCGGDRDKTKRPVMGAIAAKLSDVIVVTSDNPRSEDPNKIIDDILEGVKGTKTRKIVQPDRTKAIKAALDEAQTNDIVLLAGKGHETYQILGTGKIHYDEREIVKGLLDGSVRTD
ncbi:MAG: UDP-N-acetylmuramoyl-L-alanyl-D-glutamate--2,6-diaminopimelate ligase [Clostridiales bacterium]|nr:UDP-N-acetylmuramoyl-L-alanyl-D-glutamate--2,6-diaminopimelate ligase [Clostridiales bacterium]MCD7827200.1 UDP-N-acetylmuramoyl-L-alanyl-D-glutamate--2,6-diaminopimelate ligase [Clostridiales bacterium]